MKYTQRDVKISIGTPIPIWSLRDSRERLRVAPFVLAGEPMSAERPPKKRILTMHEWEAKHYLLAAVIILVVMGLFAYSWA